MNRQNMLRITLFISVLAFNPAVAQTLNQRTLSAIETQEQKTLGSDISKMLMEKGLEKEAAEKLSQNFMEIHSESLEKMVDNIVVSGIASHEEVVAYLGEEALFRRDTDLSRYDVLVHMLTRLHKREKLGKETLAALQKVAFKNRLLKA